MTTPETEDVGRKENELSILEKSLLRALGRQSGLDHSPLMKILCEENPPSPVIMSKLKEDGYVLFEVTPESAQDAEFMKTLDPVIYAQQQYAEGRMPVGLEELGKKVAVIFYPHAFKQCLLDDMFRYNWALNRGYGPDYDLP